MKWIFVTTIDPFKMDYVTYASSNMFFPPKNEFESNLVL